jgi:hypothetical protein
MSKLAFHLPLNSTSLGQVSFSLLRELFNQKREISLFPIGQIDNKSQKQDPAFNQWLDSSIREGLYNHSKTSPVFKIWHLNGSLESLSKEQVLLSFYELDSPTPVELNIAKNNFKTLFSSNYTISKFEEFGAKNLEFLPLAFDSCHFKQKERKENKDVIEFGLFGKLEPQRKRHLKVLSSWAKKYGNNPKYRLNCTIFNPFIDPNAQSQIIMSGLGGQKYWNINFLPHLPENEQYNEVLNNTDIVLAMSGGEGWGLPEFQTVAMGKHCVGLNAHAYKDWMTPENTTLVNPTGKIPAYDNIFFKEGALFNQGSIFDWNEDSFVSAMELAESNFIKSPINTEGLKLKEKFTYSNFTNKIISILENI